MREYILKVRILVSYYYYYYIQYLYRAYLIKITLSALHP
jgi:hypothetical protein